jgi:hypothetical protein
VIPEWRSSFLANIGLNELGKYCRIVLSLISSVACGCISCKISLAFGLWKRLSLPVYQIYEVDSVESTHCQLDKWFLQECACMHVIFVPMLKL